MAQSGGTGAANNQPITSASQLVDAAVNLDDFVRDLRAHLTLCQELLSIVERENQALRNAVAFNPAEFHQLRNSLLPRLDQSYKRLKEVRLAWQQLDPAERRRNTDVIALFRQNQDLIMKIVLLDRENEQALLRRGLVPTTQLPSVNRQRPHFVAELYRRGGS
jgi:hypothetical protein